MPDINNIDSIKDINFNSLENTYNVYLENELSPIEDNGIDTNNAYFQNVYDKVIEVFDHIFGPEDRIKLFHVIATHDHMKPKIVKTHKIKNPHNVSQIV
ncbi:MULTISPECIES: hypothetical protein [unclassified Staphylococcus]|uniref:DUF3885 domain-containing protein n=1 Tax=unclassified Staphylococcus TaxID=91994 RepID=UPI0021D14EA7|nr:MULTISPECIES: hypothetical protein [unclassified Staphylococcus]UXR77804.1 hypothetical protein MUA92_08115 [Staphylococcus sp. IVB6227]UXR81963.1 hypothetical protein MUA51_07830 [Staphylococcus sp. IVB6214]